MIKLGAFLCVALLASTALADDRDVLPLRKSQPASPSSDATESFTSTGKGELTPSGKSDRLVKAPAPMKPYIASLDTFGSTKIDEKIIRETLGTELNTWLEKGLANDPLATTLEKKLDDKLKAKFGFPFIEWSVVQYFQPGDLAIHVTLDVVEAGDLATRMPFQTPPQEILPDPDKLIKFWHAYESTALELVEKGQIEPDTEKCAAFHCPFGHKHAKLKKYERIFTEGVKKNEKALAAILTGDKRLDYRGAACYLMAYLKDGNRVVSYELTRIKDPSELVRNNALRVLGDMAELHPEYIIPARSVMPALHFPRVSDRSKSLYIIFQLAGNNHEAKEEILRNAVPDLINLLQSQQPDNRDLALGVLHKISGKDLAATDIKGWRDWYQKLPDRNLTQK